MRLLLDTHVAIWSVVASNRLPQKVIKLLKDPRNDVFVSAATIMEIAVKRSSGKVRGMPFDATESAEVFEKVGYSLLPIAVQHAAAVEDLAIAHADPFDRLILAQAHVDGLRLVTADALLADHSDTVITW
jgi:PIN domain nuclease of toxin-antitoxin system